MSSNPVEMPLGWYLITKDFRGGSRSYGLKITEEIRSKYSNAWDELFEYIGDNTDGGHCSGYTIKSMKVIGKPQGFKILQMETHTTTNRSLVVT